MVTDEQAVDIAEWNENKDNAWRLAEREIVRGFIRELLADRAERVRREAELRAEVEQLKALLHDVPDHADMDAAWFEINHLRAAIAERDAAMAQMRNVLQMAGQYVTSARFDAQNRYIPDDPGYRFRQIAERDEATVIAVLSSAPDSAHRLLDAARLCAEALSYLVNEVGVASISVDASDIQYATLKADAALAAARAAGLLNDEDGDAKERNE